MAGAIPDAAEQHQRIADAIAGKDAITAAAVMDEHMGGTIRALQGVLALPPEERRNVRYLDQKER
jgi:DNA-binding GntR family transcriptional regulator